MSLHKLTERLTIALPDTRGQVAVVGQSRRPACVASAIYRQIDSHDPPLMKLLYCMIQSLYHRGSSRLRIADCGFPALFAVVSRRWSVVRFSVTLLVAKV